MLCFFKLQTNYILLQAITLYLFYKIVVKCQPVLLRNTKGTFFFFLPQHAVRKSNVG